MNEQSGQDYAFLTLVTWPEKGDKASIAKILAPVLGMTVLDMNMRLSTVPPHIVGRFAREVSQRAADAFTQTGGLGWSVTRSELEALGESFKIKDISIVDGQLHLDLWRAPEVNIAPADIQVIVRASLREVDPNAPRKAPTVGNLYRSSSVSAAGYALLGPLGAVGAHGMATSIYGPWESTVSGFTGTQVHIDERIDIHTADNRVFQVDGDKFSFAIFGGALEPTRKRNVDKLCDMLVHLAPNAVVDPFYTLFKPPDILPKLRLPHALLNNEDPRFAFYSRWAAQMYRFLMEHPDKDHVDLLKDVEDEEQENKDEHQW